jgi:hypothetical protein
MSFINDEEETYEFLNSKTLTGTSINDTDNDNNNNYNNNYNNYNNYSVFYNEKKIEELFITTFPDVDYKSLIKRNDIINQDLILYDKINNCTYKYIFNRGWSKINYN